MIRISIRISGETFAKVSPEPSSKAFEEGFYIAEIQATLPRSQRIAGAVTFSDSLPHWLPQFFGPLPLKLQMLLSHETQHIGKPRSQSDISHTPRVYFTLRSNISLIVRSPSHRHGAHTVSGWRCHAVHADTVPCGKGFGGERGLGREETFAKVSSCPQTILHLSNTFAHAVACSTHLAMAGLFHFATPHSVMALPSAAPWGASG